MTNTVFIGHIQNATLDTKILALAENAEAARRKILANFRDTLGYTFQDSDVRIIPFAS